MAHYKNRKGFVLNQGPDSNGGDWAFQSIMGKKIWKWRDQSGIEFIVTEVTDVSMPEEKGFQLEAGSNTLPVEWEYKELLPTSESAFWVASEAYKEWTPKGPQGPFAKAFKKIASMERTAATVASLWINPKSAAAPPFDVFEEYLPYVKDPNHFMQVVREKTHSGNWEIIQLLDYTAKDIRILEEDDVDVEYTTKGGVDPTTWEGDYFTVTTPTRIQFLMAGHMPMSQIPRDLINFEFQGLIKDPQGFAEATKRIFGDKDKAFSILELWKKSLVVYLLNTEYVINDLLHEDINKSKLLEENFEVNPRYGRQTFRSSFSAYDYSIPQNQSDTKISVGSQGILYTLHVTTNLEWDII